MGIKRLNLAAVRRITDNSARRLAMKAIKKEVKIERPAREKVSREEAIRRMKSLPKRKERIIAAIREGSR